MKISLPFILSVLIVGIIWISYIFLFITAVVPSIDPIIAEPVMSDIVAALAPYIMLFGVGLVIMLIISLLIQAFFTAGAIGMAKDVAANGRTSYEEMFNSGKTHFLNYFLLQVLVYLIILAGIIFLIPGILQIGDLTNLDAIMQSLLALGVGFALWIVYSIIISIILAVTYYALVVDNLGPIQAIKAGYRFFLNNKAAVAILWLITIVVAVTPNVIGMLFTPFEYLSIIWSVVSAVLSIVVLPAVFTLWWTFLYMGKTGRDVRDPKRPDYLELGPVE
ncbi:hypothetical protein Mpsy_0016 [Methanolobus psychrophilus R15]|nr:hypothetical protein Mpsy_0016 [Methanolobus psychrophilus R15]